MTCFAAIVTGVGCAAIFFMILAIMKRLTKAE